MQSPLGLVSFLLRYLCMHQSFFRLHTSSFLQQKCYHQTCLVVFPTSRFHFHTVRSLLHLSEKFTHTFKHHIEGVDFIHPVVIEITVAVGIHIKDLCSTVLFPNL